MEQKNMENRIEKVREYVDNVLLNMTDTVERRCAYLHLYGVAQACAMIAQKRKENVELAIVAGMLHDIFSYKTMDHQDHAHKGAVMAKEILNELDIFDNSETDMICDAIYNHSDKAVKQTPFNEILIDADVLQHYLYNPFLTVSESEKMRLENLKTEFCL
ncbi:MAG: HD domain-containing protein [Oscillospiraceae bacterium]|nr:HD domain-containing protein [Oscillospiraceae bacterium]